MKKKKPESKPNLFKIPKGFKEHKGRCSWDMPQELYRESDFHQIEIFRRNGDIEVATLCEVNWTATFLKTDVIAWRHLEYHEESHEDNEI